MKKSCSTSQCRPSRFQQSPCSGPKAFSSLAAAESMTGNASKRMLPAAALLLLLFLGAALFSYEGIAGTAGDLGSAQGNASTGPTKISPAQLRQMMKAQEVFLLNVENSAMDEIRGTDAWIAEGNFSIADSRLPQDKTVPVVVYSRTGSYSRIVAYGLYRAGYSQAYDLDGGKVAFVNSTSKEIDALKENVVPAKGVALEARWPRSIPLLFESGAINRTKFYETQDKWNKPVAMEQEAVLDGSGDYI